MRWLVTLLLLVLVLAGGFWLAAGDRIRSVAGVAPPEPTATSFGILDQYLKIEAIREVKITAPGQSPLTLTRTSNGGWAQPGNWPLRDDEVAQLIGTLSGLRSRFIAVPLGDDLAPFGLNAGAKKVEVSVDVTTDTSSRALKLAFGQPPIAAGESGFARPCYLRIDDQPEAIRLGPDVYPILARSPEVYRRRQLFPDFERVKLTGGEPPPDPLRPSAASAGRVAILGDGVASIHVEQTGTPAVSYTLKRTAKTPEPHRDPDHTGAEPALTANQLATAWELTYNPPTGAPGSAQPAVRDRVDPAKLRAVLTAIPDLWVESFHPPVTKTNGLDKPERTITVTRADGNPMVLQLGSISRTVRRDEPLPPPMFGMPPMPPSQSAEQYRYAKLAKNDLVFEIRTDKLNDLFADPQEFRDPALVRFETGDVTELTITVKGKPPVKVVRKKGSKDAEQEEDKQDRWYVDGVLADSARVTELLDQLGRMEARGKENVIDGPSPAKLKELEIDPSAGTRVTLVLQPKVAEGETPPPAKTVTLVIGKADAEKKKLNVQVVGWDRVSAVDDTALKLIDRPSLAYRSRRLFDTAEMKLATVSVTRDNGEVFALAQKPKAEPAGSNGWVLTKPVATDADDAKAGLLTGDLSRLEAIEYVDDAPPPVELDTKYGLAKPRFVVELGFTGQNAKPQKLELGAAREGKPEVYARLNGGGVFAIGKAVADSLEGGAVALVPLQLWQIPTDKVTTIQIRRGEAETYTLTLAGNEWKLSGPFDATAGYADVIPLLSAAASARADKCEAITGDPAKYGLDKPALRIAVTSTDSKPGPLGAPPVETTVTKAILIGKPAALGTRFAKMDGGPTQAVFVIPDALVKAADKPAIGWLDKALLVVDPTRLVAVQLTSTTPDANVKLTKDDKGVWKPDGIAFPVDNSVLEDFLRVVARLPVARLIDYGPAVKWAEYGLDKPTQTITIALAGEKPESHEVKFGKSEPSGERYVRVDDGPALGVLAPGAASLLNRGRLDFIDHTLMTFDLATLTKWARKGGTGGDLELTLTGPNWEITKPTKQNADRVSFDNLAFQLSQLRAVKIVAFAPADLDKPFGLKSPAATFTLTLTMAGATPETKVLKLGNPVEAAKPDGDRYATVEGAAGAPVKVGVVPGRLAQSLLAGPLKFRDRTLAKFADANRVTVERGDRKVTFALIGGLWKMTEPVAADAEALELDELVRTLSDLRADEWVAEKPDDVKPFGLDKPQARWKLFADDKEVLSLVVGANEKNGPRVYARLEKGDLVALLDPITSTRILGEHRKRAIWADLDAAQVETFTIKTGNATVAFQKTPTGWVDPTSPTDVVDVGKLTESLAALASLKAEHYVADKDAKLALYGLESPKLVVTVTVRGVPKALHLGGPVGGTDGKQVYARLPDQTAVFILSAADTAKLTRDRAAYITKK